MNPVETFGLALGAGFSSGLNLYATVATLGLLQRFGVLHLPPSLQALSHPWVLGIAIALYLVEFCADKIPYLDTVWDAIQDRKSTRLNSSHGSISYAVFCL